MQVYLFPMFIATIAILLGLVNLIFPPVLSVIIIIFGILAAYAIVKINEG